MEMQRVKQSCQKLLSNHKGDLAKLKVRIHLEELGYTVFVAPNINQYGDFVIMPTGRIIKVKSASKTLSGYKYGHLSHHNYDVLALVVGNTIIYQEINP